MKGIDPTVLKTDASLSTIIIINEAFKRGIKYEVVVPRKIVLFSYNGHEEYMFFQACNASGLVAKGVCGDKGITKAFLKKAGLSTPAGETFKSNQKEEAFALAEKLGWPIVLKPLEGRHGDCVFSSVNKEDFSFIWDKVLSDDIIVEKRFSGKEYRIWATKNKVCGIVNRIPANVVGDGVLSIQQLIDIKNSDPMRGNYGEPKPLKKIQIDDAMMINLKTNNLKLDSIIPKGQVAYLRDNSNLSTGGDSIDCFDQAHSSVFEIAIKAVNAIPSLAYVGMDFMTKDVTKEQRPEDYTIIELNDSPGLDGVHFPSVGTPRNAAKEIIDLIFPETITKG